MSSAKRTRTKPLPTEVSEFVRHHLADKRAFAPFTGTDFDAWHAYIYLVRLWGRTRSQGVVDALRAVVATAQTRHEDVMAVFKKSIPCLLDWSDEPRLWFQIGPTEQPEISDIARARIKRALERYSPTWTVADNGEPRRVMWPCDDGPRVCHHLRSKPYGAGVYEDPDHADYRECKDCGAVWKQTVAVPQESR